MAKVNQASSLAGNNLSRSASDSYALRWGLADEAIGQSNLVLHPIEIGKNRIWRDPILSGETVKEDVEPLSFVWARRKSLDNRVIEVPTYL